MVAVSSRLSVLAYANGFTSWHYKLHEDELVHAAHVPGYLDRALTSAPLAIGDTILMSGPDGAALRCVVGLNGGVQLAALV